MADYNVKDYGAVGDGVTDDRAAIQAALDAARDAGGGRVVVPPGVYLLGSALIIDSNIHFFVDRLATIKRGSEENNMIRSADKGAGGYDGVHDVIIEGGTWDGNGQNLTTAATSIMFGHCRNITVRGVRMVNTLLYHCIEFNACQHVLVEGCTFDGQVGDRDSEAVQLDLMKGSGQFPWYGPYDNTPCDDVTIHNNRFLNWSRGVGTHSYTDGVYQTRIRITDNHFENLWDHGVYAENWEDVVIKGNTFYKCYTGVELNRYCYGVAIQGNTFSYCTNNAVNVYTVSQGNTIQGNSISENGGQGISLYDGCDLNTIQGNTIRYSGEYGIVVNASDDNLISGNLVYGSGQNGGGNANIRITGGTAGNSYRNAVIGNVCRSGNRANKPGSGVSVASYGYDTLIKENDLRNTGTPIDNAGVGTIAADNQA
jgi:parallel beta-helix repeat protein